MKEKPIIFSGEMVRAILDGRKTMTRRVIKPQPTGEPRPLSEWSIGIAAACHDHDPDPELLKKHSDQLRGRIFPFTTGHGTLSSPACPCGKPGDRLWVRETFCAEKGDAVYYRADGWEYGDSGGWKSPLYMPREVSRITLEITDIRVERVQDISEADIIAEGCPNEYLLGRSWFKPLWDSIHSKDGFDWAANPWCWVIEFKKI